MTRLRTSLLFSAVAQQSNLLISFFSIAVVARLLTPAEIGVFAVASSLTVLAIEFRSIGVGQYLVREKELTEEKKRTAFGMMLLISWSFALVIIMSAQTIAVFYSQPDLRYIFWILSGTFILAPFSTIPFAILLRDMRFDQVLRIKLSSGIARSGGSIGFVLLGWSYFGLAAGVLLGAIIELTAISLIDRSKSLLRPSFKLWREILGFGTVTSVTGMLQRFTQSVPDLVLGRTATMADVGLFSRGLGMILFINKLISLAVNPVLLPHLSGIRRREGDVGKEYLKCISLHGAVSLPAFATAAVIALPLIQLFFGDQWDAAAPIASVLAIWAMLQTVHGFLPIALVAMNRERIALLREITIFSIRIILIIIAASEGLIAVAWAMCITGVFDLALSTFLAARYLNITWRHVCNSFIPNAALTAVSSITALLMLGLLSEHTSSIFVQISVTSITVFLGWLATLRLTNHDLWPIGCEMITDGISTTKQKLNLGGTPR